MNILSKLNRPITLSKFSEKYVNNSRPMNQEELDLLNKEIELRVKNTEINWVSPRTYMLSLLCALITFLIGKSLIIAGISFIAFFIIFELIPFLTKGDSALLKKDINGGFANIKSGPVTVVEDNYGKTYMKRSYLEDVIIDGIYSKDDKLKYPNLLDGQQIEVTYSPNAQYIFSVRTL